MKIKLDHRRQNGWVLLVVGIMLVILLACIVAAWLIDMFYQCIQPPAPIPDHPTTNIIEIDSISNQVVTKSALPAGIIQPSFYVAYGFSDSNNWGNYTFWSTVSTNPIAVVTNNTMYDDDRGVAYATSQGGFTFEIVTDGDANLLFTTNTTPIPIVISRSTNLIDWTAVFTNTTCGLDTIEVYEDLSLADVVFYEFIRQ